MTDETERTVTGRESSTRSGAPSGEGAAHSVYYSAARHGQHVEESPELLRWRADLLMDEMMMGGADGSAADSNTRTFSGVDSVTSSPDPYYPTRNGADHYGQANPANGDRTGRQDGMPLSGGRYDGRDSQDRYAPGMDDRAPSGLPGGEGYTNGRESTYGAMHDSVRRDFGADEPLSTPPARPAPPPYSASSPEDAAAARTRVGDPGTADRYNHTGDYPTGSSQGSDVDRAGVDFGFDAEPSAPRTPSQPLPQDRRLDLPSSPPRTHLDVAPVSSEGGTPTRTDRLYSVEQRYEQLRREQADRIEPTPIPPPPAVVAKPPRSAPAAATPDANDPTQWATGPEKWNWQDFGAQPGAEPVADDDSVAAGRYGGMDRAPQADSAAVRQDPAQFVNSMAVFENRKKRSTLLPRMSELDADLLHREITTLHGELALLLPVGNETGERARHLLDKAYTILQSDPMRSAEVEYYMQQVRTIVSRLHQSRQWSDLYRSRLHVYLWAWLGLSLVLLLARFIFQPEFDDFLVTTFGLAPDSFLVQNWSAFLGAAFAGALGGAAGALYTMRVHARTEYGFFDRKYGLRGLILPVIGLLVGAVGYSDFRPCLRHSRD